MRPVSVFAVPDPTSPTYEADFVELVQRARAESRRHARAAARLSARAARHARLAADVGRLADQLAGVVAP